VGALPAALTTQAPKTIGRYLLFDEIAAGGMATVHVARLMGPIGFARTVAIKQIHRHLAKDEKVRSMFIDEARMAARVRHPNVVSVLDVIASDGELLLVMDYVHGESLSRLAPPSSEGTWPVPVPIASAILIGVLHGLHAAHEAKDEKGQPLQLVHRDVSPQNILVGQDGVPRVVDFGIAKAAGRIQTTAEGQLKGKARYLAPEQVLDAAVDRRADLYAASVVLWELLAGRRLFDGGGAASTLRQVLSPTYEAPSRHAPAVPVEVDRLVMRGLAREPGERFASAWETGVPKQRTR
jgi:serine/threonine-protein kinase